MNKYAKIIPRGRKMSNDLTQNLHDRATRGEALSAEEKAKLEAWYKAQDKLESDLLNKNTRQDFLDERRKQIQTVLGEIQEFSLRMRKISTENDILRHENQLLRENLTENVSV